MNYHDDALQIEYQGYSPLVKEVIKFFGECLVKKSNFSQFLP